jgi:hypothetical protein
MKSAKSSNLIDIAEELDYLSMYYSTAPCKARHAVDVDEELDYLE